MVVRFLVFVLAWVAGAGAEAATFVVTSAADTAGSTCGSTCTLRQAITAANATAAADTINFAITVPPRGDILIAPTSALPTITQPLTINGYSQSGTRQNDDPVNSNAVLRIRLDGANAGNVRGLANCATGDVSIRGLAITRFSQAAIFHGADAFGTVCAAGIATIEGNFIGVGGNGVTFFTGNIGVVARSPVIVGGASPAQRNVISNNGNALSLGAGTSGSQVDGNLFGTDKNGAELPVTGTGIFMIDAGNRSIGTLAPNVIRNFSVGVTVSANVRGIDLANNRIGGHSDLGIDLNNDGVTLNDTNDPDSGANDLQNFPLITGAQRVAGGLSLSGSLDVGHAGLLSYKLTSYASSSCHPSGHGEGERILGQTNRNFSSTAESFSYTQNTGDPLPPGTVITMTATRAGVGTSEFSACFSLDPLPLVVNSNNDVADGSCNAAHCSLRDAIIASNASAGAGFLRIHFAIPPLSGTSEIVIAPTSQLPDITRRVTIDGYTQPGATPNTDPTASNAAIRIRIDGQGAPASARGLRPCAAGSVIRGLSITRFNTGIEACPTSPSLIAGNFIGLAANGATAATNSGGLALNSGPLDVGSSAIADRNVIVSASVGIAVGTLGNGSHIDNNLFGSDRTGTLPRGTGTGVFPNASAANVDIGTAAPNAFRFLPRAISLAGNAGIGIRFGANSFSSHSILAVDLGADGVTPNDPGDGDTGPNNLQNFPVLTLAERTPSGLRVVGDLDSGTNVTFAFYASADCHSSGHGPGEQLLETRFTTSPSSFDFGLITDVDLSVFDTITATATGGNGSSEMSACIAVTDPPPGIAVDTASDSTTVNGGCDVTGDGNTCTLREAITLANAQAGSDTIRFAIPGDGPHIISLVSNLPQITQGLSIDGYTQQGAVPNADPLASDAVIKIEIRGGSNLTALTTCTGELIDLRGLALNGGSLATVTEAAASTCTGPLRVRGSWIGFAASGASIGGNIGIVAREPLTFGGTALADRNVVGNYSRGLVFRDQASGSVVSNSLFGRSPDLTQGAVNDVSIEFVDVGQVAIGGDGALRNQFFGGTTSILVGGANADSNQLYGNTFAGATGGTAIDLTNGSSPDGITANDVNDIDTGANEGQNSPVLTDGTANSSSITINGLLDVPADILIPVNYRLAFYSSTSCSDDGGVLPDRNGEDYLGAFVQPFASNAENFSITLSAAPAQGFITATATSPGGSTSEISNCLIAPRPNNLFADGFE
jgi:CSLREA domain-containing protein